MHPKIKKINLNGIFKRNPQFNLQGYSNTSSILDSTDQNYSINISKQISVDNQADQQLNQQKQFPNNTHNQSVSLTRSYTFQIKCIRCEVRKAQIVCKYCNMSQYCSDCNTQVHSVGKFSCHSQIKIKSKQHEMIVTQSNNPEFSDSQFLRVSEDQQVQKINNMKKQLTTMNISQVWMEVLKNIENNFKSLAQQLQTKKQEILKKVKSRLQQQIDKYQQSICEYHILLQQFNSISHNMKKSTIKDKIQILQNKIMEIEHQYKIDENKKQNRYKVTSAYFDELQLAIKKINLKNIIQKNYFEPQILPINKSKVKSSLQSPTNISTNLSPAFKTPKNGKSHNYRLSNFSNSAHDDDIKSIKYKIDRPFQNQNIVTTKKTQNVSKNEYNLTKIKSEKLFPKSNAMGSPKSAMGKITEYFNSNKRNNLKKVHS